MGGITPARWANAFVSNLLVPGLRKRKTTIAPPKSSVNVIGMYSDHIRNRESDKGCACESRAEDEGQARPSAPDFAIILEFQRQRQRDKPLKGRLRAKSLACYCAWTKKLRNSFRALIAKFHEPITGRGPKAAFRRI